MSLEALSSEELGKLLAQQGVRAEAVAILQRENVAGRHLAAMNDAELQSVGLGFGDRVDILKAVKSAASSFSGSVGQGCSTSIIPSPRMSQQSTLSSVLESSRNFLFPGGGDGSNSLDHDTHSFGQNNIFQGTVSFNSQPAFSMDCITASDSAPCTSSTLANVLPVDASSTYSLNSEQRLSAYPTYSGGEGQEGSNSYTLTTLSGRKSPCSLEASEIMFDDDLNVGANLFEEDMFSSCFVQLPQPTVPVISTQQCSGSANTSQNTSTTVSGVTKTALAKRPISAAQTRINNTLQKAAASSSKTAPSSSKTALMTKARTIAGQAAACVTPPPSNPFCLETSSVRYLNSEQRISKLMGDAFQKCNCNFDIDAILLEFKENGGETISKDLEKNQFVAEGKRKMLANLLVTYILTHSRPNIPEVVMREEMAIALVCKYPKLKKPKLLTQRDMPWHNWFNPATNMGFLQNVNAGSQRATKRVTGVGRRKSNKTPGQPRKLVTLPENCPDPDDPDPEEFLRNVQEARNTLATSGQKANILALMSSTFDRRRRQFSLSSLTTNEIVNKYPHFRSYNGEVIELEFQKMFPQSASNFIRNFAVDFIPKLMKIARDNPDKYASCFKFENDGISALFILLKLLPVPRRSYAHEAKQPLHADVADLILMINSGCDPQHEADSRRQQAKYYIQPHLMATGTPKAIGKFYLVLGDSQVLELSRSATPTNAIDLLIKTYFVLNLHYPLGWKNVFRFLARHVYDIPPENPRESAFDDALSLILNTPFS